MKYIKKVNELKDSKIVTHEAILEMARINNLKEFPYDVFVYGGSPLHGGRCEHGEPHFHFADKIEGGDFHFSILIPTIEEWKNSNELYIYESSTGSFTWSGLKSEKKELIKWLNTPYFDMTSMTNIQFIRLQWNVLNRDNKNVKQIKTC